MECFAISEKHVVPQNNKDIVHQLFDSHIIFHNVVVTTKHAKFTEAAGAAR